MTGPDHYREAERLVAHSKNHTDQGNGADDKIGELAAAQAQVHATLALAAATVETAYSVASRGSDNGIRIDWMEVVQ